MSTPLPPPFTTLPSIHNLRHLPSHPLPLHPSSSPSHLLHLRPSIIWRSADPYNADPTQLRALGIQKVFDLRSLPEIERAPHGLGWASGTGVPGLERIWVPVFPTADYSPERLGVRFALYMKEGKEGFPQAYLEILEAASNAYTTILRSLLDAPNTPILIHCTAGKDRTGLIIALLLSVLGATEESIIEEYALTKIGLAGLRPVFTARIYERVVREGVVERLGEEKVREGIRRAVGADARSLRWTFELVRERWGSAEGWVREECGFRDEEIEGLRRGLVE